MTLLPVTGVILAGGVSRRMGRDKAWVELGGVPLIVRVIERLRLAAHDLLIVANDDAAYAPLGLPIVADIHPGNAALGGIHAGLAAAQHEYSIVVACDMPLLNPALLRYLVSLAPGYDVVVPSVPTELDESSGKSHRQPSAKDQNLHPLHAVYSRQCLAPIARAIARGDRRMISFYDEVRVRVVETEEVERFDPNHLSVFNVNTPERLERAAALLKLEGESIKPG